jgi:hypothetical protein
LIGKQGKGFKRIQRGSSTNSLFFTSFAFKFEYHLRILLQRAYFNLISNKTSEFRILRLWLNKLWGFLILNSRNMTDVTFVHTLPSDSDLNDQCDSALRSVEMCLKQVKKQVGIPRALMVLKCMAAIGHYYQCCEDSQIECQIIACKKIARLETHLECCKRQKTCPICRQFLSLLKIHSSGCRVGSCKVRNCQKDNFDR